MENANTTTATAATKKRANAVVTMEQAGNNLSFNVLGAGTITLDMTKLNEAILTRAAIHGLKQRISDAAAIPCDPETGKPASPADKFVAMEALVNHYNSGSSEWARNRAEGGERAPNGGKILTAIMNVYKFSTVEKAREVVEATAKKRGIEYKAALNIWKSSDKIAAELSRMAAATSTVDADDLLGELSE